MNTKIPSITIGLDLGDKKHAICVLNKAGEFVDARSIISHRDSLRRLSGKHPKARIAPGSRHAQPADADLWATAVSREYRKLLMAGAVGKSAESVGRDGKMVTKTLRKGISKQEAENETRQDGEIPFGKMLRCRVRYFTDGAVIGSRRFVDEAFAKSRERFGLKRKTGARRLKGDAAPAGGVLWSLRDLRKGIA
ncbi:MAG TPA: hypothetical protein VF258_07660 [Luteolibacter sp.]